MKSLKHIIKEEIESTQIPKGTSGDCYRNVQDYLMDNEIPNGIIIHGEVTSRNGTLKHAWIEDNDIVYDPTTGVKTSKQKYYQILNPKVEDKYTFEQALKLRFKTGNYGPWTRAEQIVSEELENINRETEVETNKILPNLTGKRIGQVFWDYNEIQNMNDKIIKHAMKFINHTSWQALEDAQKYLKKEGYATGGSSKDTPLPVIKAGKFGYWGSHDIDNSAIPADYGKFKTKPIAIADWNDLSTETIQNLDGVLLSKNFVYEPVYLVFFEHPTSTLNEIVQEEIQNIFPISFEKFIDITEMDVDDNAKEYYSEMVKLFNGLPNPIPVYRLIFVDNVKNINLKKLGTSWTWDTNNWDDLISSTLYDDEIDGGGNITVLLSGLIDKRYVDWESTVKKYVTQHLYTPDFEENEIVIPPKSYPYIKNLKWKIYDELENIVQEEIGNLLNEKTYKVYHGTNNQFDKFDFKRATQGIVWFTDSIDSIKKGEHGGQGSKYIMTRYITINNPAGWDEYEKYGLQQLEDMGYDGVILPQGNKTDYFVFSNKSIRKAEPKNMNELENWYPNQPTVSLVNESEDLTSHINQFLTQTFYGDIKYKDIINSCDLSKGNCSDVTEELYNFLIKLGYDKNRLKIIELKLPKFSLDNAHPEISADKNMYHDILKIDNKYIDLTGAQFGEEFAGIKIYTLEELKNYWNKITNIDEGIADKAAERMFGIPDSSKEQERQASSAIMPTKSSSMGEFAGTIGGDMKVYKNPKSLEKFEPDVRAVSTIDGDLYVATVDGIFTHRGISDAVNWENKKTGAPNIPDAYDAFRAIQWYRYKDTNMFVLSTSFTQINHMTNEMLNKAVRQAEIKNPTSKFYAKEYYDVENELDPNSHTHPNQPNRHIYVDKLDYNPEDADAGGYNHHWGGGWLDTKEEDEYNNYEPDEDELPSNINLFKEMVDEELQNMVNDSVQAWHGSPYDFDKFSTEKIGSGEGAQAFGWGIYFTDTEDIAKYYSDSTTNIRFGGEKELISRYIESIAKFLNNPEKYANDRFRVYEDPKYDYFVNTINNHHGYKVLHHNISYDEAYDYMRKRFEKLKEAYKEYDKGNKIYQVTLHKGKTPDQYDWLLWDKPITMPQREKISAQAAKENMEFFLVKNDAFNSYVKKMQDEMNKKSTFSHDALHLDALRKNSLQGQIDIKLYYIVNDVTGKEVYNLLASSRYLDSPKEASLFLLRAGIDGIKYPADSLSKTKTNTTDSFNYVVFDPNAVTIEKKIDTKKYQWAEGVADKYAEKTFNIPDPNKEMDIKAQAGIKPNPTNGTYMGDITYSDTMDFYYDSDYDDYDKSTYTNKVLSRVFANPKNLTGFGRSVRAVSDRVGNIFVAETDGNFFHDNLTHTVMRSEKDDVEDTTYIQWYRKGWQDAFVMSNSFVNFNKPDMSYGQLMTYLKNLIDKNPQFKYYNEDDYEITKESIDAYFEHLTESIISEFKKRF